MRRIPAPQTNGRGILQKRVVEGADPYWIGGLSVDLRECLSQKSVFMKGHNNEFEKNHYNTIVGSSRI